jgi:AcrR family transcriptional regulator
MRRAAAKEKTRFKLIASARECFATHGYHKTTVRMIASGAELTTGALFAHWQNKEQIYVDVHGHVPISPEEGLELRRQLEAANQQLAEITEKIARIAGRIS